MRKATARPTRPPRPEGTRRVHLERLGLLAGAAALTLVLGACGEPVDGAASAPRTRVHPVLPSSLTTVAGTWASVPMGHLGHPLDTFWQLFFLPARGSAWRNHASQLGVADNGGVLLATPGDGRLLVGLPPSNHLRYSPMVTTRTGRVWTAANPVQGPLASLAAGAGGKELAVVRTPAGGSVLESRGPRSPWHPLVTAEGLRSAPGGRACAPVAVSVVAFSAAGTPLVGGACRHHRVTGIFEDQEGRWRSIGPAIGPRPADVRMLSLQGTPAGIDAFFSVTSASGPAVVRDFYAAAGSWHLSAGLPLGRGGRVVSMGATPSGGEFVLFRRAFGEERLAVLGPAATSWTPLPRPPQGTETVAFVGTGRLDALAVHDTVMTDWTLGRGSWEKRQTTRVDVVFGSST